MADRIRPAAPKKANFRGINTRLQADAMPDGKYPFGVNVRADGDSNIHTRPGYQTGFSAGASRITDISSYAALGTDSQPRIVVHDSGGGVWLDNGVKQGTVGQGGVGASMIPWRPTQSPQSWMYICNATGYSKLSAPGAANGTTFQKVGIAEPQSMPEACPDGFVFNEFTGVAANWTPAGTAGSTSDVTRSSDTAVAIFEDPAAISPTLNPRYSVQVSTSVSYQVGESLRFAKSGGGSFLTSVEDVYPPLNTGTAITIQSILYFTGSSGRCVIVPSQTPVGNLVSQTSTDQPQTSTIPTLSSQLSTLRRGSLLQLNSSEVVLVLSVTVGPRMEICFECSTSTTHSSGETIAGVPAIAVSGISNLVVGQSITAGQINSVISKGIGTLTATLSPNPFNLKIGTFGTPQEDDLIHVSLTATSPQNISELKIAFDIGDGTFGSNFLYFSVSASQLQAAVSNQALTGVVLSGLTQGSVVYQSIFNSLVQNSKLSPSQATSVLSSNGQLFYNPANGTAQINNPDGGQYAVILNFPFGSGAGQYTEVTFSINSLIRVGNDQTKSLATCNGVQLLANVSGSTTIGFGSLWVGGGGQPDVGISGSPYYYRTVPRSSLTGALSNPSPGTRYGVLPRLQPVIVNLPSVAYDSQIDTVDIYRWGGSILSWRYIGSAKSTATTFTDNILDSAANGGSVAEFDNYEPWPTVDQPWNATTGSGGISSIAVYGTAIVVMGTIFPTTTLRWLPGTELLLDGNYTYTLWNRPVAIAGGVLFRTVENMGSPSVSTVVVQEPIVANQPNPYLWGPDANGIMYAAGDALRPGFFQGSKPNNPDAANNNAYDLVPPSEPLLGGEIVDGLSLVASSKRWWQLQYAPNTPQGWNPVETPAGRGLAAPYGHCTDGKFVYFVASDGIYSMLPGLPAELLSDADIGNLFPVEGIPQRANITYAGQTIYAPNYQYASQFRLSILNALLRFHYYDSTGMARTLELDMSLDSEGKPRMAWAMAQYADPITNSYQPRQPSSTLASVSALYSNGYFADSNGKVWIESDLHNDNATAIVAMIAVPEWDAGDSRVNKQWLDAMTDMIPAGSVTATPVSNRVAAGSAIPISSSTSRTQNLSPLGNSLHPYLGLLFNWSDDFTAQSTWTQLFEWSVECVPQPLVIRSWISVATSHGLKGYQHIGRIRFAYMTLDANPATLTITAYDGTSPSVISLPGTSGSYQKTEFVPTFNKGLLYTYQLSHPTGIAPDWASCEVLVGAWDRTSEYASFQGLGGLENP